MPGQVFGVDRGRIRFAHFSSGEDGDPSFREYQSEPLPGTLFQSGPLGGPARDVDQLGAALGALLGRITNAPSEASLVLPDEWLRVAFAELEDVQRRTKREDVLRFKLRRLVPFRVEDLRVAGVDLPPVSGGSQRILLGFAVEALLQQLEALFSGHGVTLGHISNESLALVSMLAPLLTGGSPAVVAHVSERSYSLLVTDSGQPVLHRFKSLGESPAAREMLVPKDLRLTRTYLQRELKGRRFGEVVLVAPEDQGPRWNDWLAQAFDHQVRSLVDEWAELPGTVVGVPSWDAAPLLGAASRTVR